MKDTNQRTVERLCRRLDKEFHFTKRSPGRMAPAFALGEDWEGQCVFCLPPTGNPAEWARKCHTEGKKPGTCVVLLIPAKTDASYFHDYIMDQAEIRFIQGRLTQENGGRPAVGSLVAIYRGPLPLSLKPAIVEILQTQHLTSAEIHAELKRKGYRAQINGVTPRLSQLADAGRIRKAGKRACTVSGRSSTVWISNEGVQ